MRIYELNPIADTDIKDTHVLAVDESVSTKKITLAQLRRFLGVGENSKLIPSGTDIRVYFQTAKSGEYYGEGLLNTAQTGAWFAFDWTTHEQGRGTLIETTNGNEMAVHSLAAGNWTRKKIISESGGTMTGKLVIESDDNAIRLKNITQDDYLYLEGRNLDDVQRWIIGSLTANSDDVSIYNSSQNTSIDLLESGNIQLKPSSGKSVLCTGGLRVADAAGLYSQSTSCLIRWATDSGGYIQIGSNTAGHRVNIGGTAAGNINLFTAGDVTSSTTFIPAKYDNFDARNDARYVSNIQLGAQVHVTGSSNGGLASLTAPAGHVLTAILDGDSSRFPMPDTPDSAYAKPIQKKAYNGQWVTIGG